MPLQLPPIHIDKIAEAISEVHKKGPGRPKNTVSDSDRVVVLKDMVKPLCFAIATGVHLGIASALNLHVENKTPHLDVDNIQ